MKCQLEGCGKQLSKHQKKWCSTAHKWKGANVRAGHTGAGREPLPCRACGRPVAVEGKAQGASRSRWHFEGWCVRVKVRSANRRNCARCGDPIRTQREKDDAVCARCLAHLVQREVSAPAGDAAEGIAELREARRRTEQSLGELRRILELPWPTEG